MITLFRRLKTITSRPETQSRDLKTSRPCFPHILLFTLLMALLFSNAVYCATEHDRQGMNQRARAELEEILNTKEFKGQISRPSWWSKLVDRFLPRLPGGVGWIGALLEWLSYLTLVFIVVGICIFIARRFRRSPSFAKDLNIPIESSRHTDPETAKAQAHECFQRGEYRQAIRYLYLSLLLNLNRAGLLSYDVAKTNGEYLGEIRISMSDRAERFASLTQFFERKWYGMEESSAGDFQQCEETFAELVVGD